MRPFLAALVLMLIWAVCQGCGGQEPRAYVMQCKTYRLVPREFVTYRQCDVMLRLIRAEPRGRGVALTEGCQCQGIL